MLAELDAGSRLDVALVETARTMDLELVFIWIVLLVGGGRRECRSPAGFARAGFLMTQNRLERQQRNARPWFRMVCGRRTASFIHVGVVPKHRVAII